MCSYWYRHHELPARPALYRQLVLDTAFRWRGFAAPAGHSVIDELLGNENQFLAMLARVAVRIHDEHVDGQMKMDELLDALDDALYGIGRYKRVDARQAALELVDRIRAKVGILAEFSDGEFGFIHQTFREYLAGHDLLRAADRPGRPDDALEEQLFLQLRDRIGDPRWREPVLMALGECTAATRVALMSLAVRTPGIDLEEWTGMFLAAALERPTTDSNTAELTRLLELAMHAAELTRGIPDLLNDLDAQLAGLRRHLGQERFDFLAMSLFTENEDLAPRPWRPCTGVAVGSPPGC